MKHLIGLMLAVFATPAMAQTAPVVLVCSGQDSNLLTHNMVFRITPEAFSVWDSGRGIWDVHPCSARQAAGQWNCETTPGRYAFVLWGADRNALNVDINRSSGSFTYQDYAGGFYLHTGQCRPTAEPAAPAAQF